MIKINGEKKELANINLLDYLLKNGFKTEVLAVELNGRIVKKRDKSYFGKYENAVTPLCDGDIVEIVSFVGGG